MPNTPKPQTVLPLDTPDTRNVEKPQRRESKHRANDLDGGSWTRNSVSIWPDIRKTSEEWQFKHPAMFPVALVTRLIQCFTTEEDRVIMDPFAGVGSTLIAAEALGKDGIGIEISPEFAEKARTRSITDNMLAPSREVRKGKRILYCADANALLDYVKANCIDFVVTSPPYWDILLQKRTADYKETRHYGDEVADLGKISDYTVFLKALQNVFGMVYEVLKPGKYCCVVVMDLRKKDRFYPFHMDVCNFMQELGFVFDDIIIWDRRHEYNNLRPLGYPHKFRINKVHEYILIFQKPRQ